MMAKEGSMFLSVLRFITSHLVHFGDIYSVYWQNCGRYGCQFLLAHFDFRSSIL